MSLSRSERQDPGYLMPRDPSDRDPPLGQNTLWRPWRHIWGWHVALPEGKKPS